MSVTVSVRTNFQDVAIGYRGNLGSDGVKRAAVTALNRTADGVRTAAARAVREAYGSSMSYAAVRSQITVSRRASAADLVAVVQARGRRRLPLNDFKVRQTGSGVSVRIGRRLTQIPSAFIKAKKGGVYIRAKDFKAVMYDTSPAARRKRISKTGPDFPIAQLMAPGIPLVFLRKRITAVLVTEARQRFAVEFARVLKFRSQG